MVAALEPRAAFGVIAATSKGIIMAALRFGRFDLAFAIIALILTAIWVALAVLL
jgi:hypothetical protein